MPKYNFHMGVTLRCYGDVEIEADSIDAALPLITADYIAENIEITETTTDSGQDLAVLDVSDAVSGEYLPGYDGHFLPSPYDPQPDADLLAALKTMVAQAREVLDTLSNEGRDDVPEWIKAAEAAEAAIAKAEGRTNG